MKKIFKAIRRMYFRLIPNAVARYYNRMTLLRIANMPAEGMQRLTYDEHKLLTDFIALIQGSNLATRNGKVVYRLDTVDEVSLWQMLETRRAEDALERIKAWTGDNYEATTIADAVKLDKYIRECLETADNLERALFSSVVGGESALTGGEEIKEAKNLLGIVQTTADLFKCTFEEAKRMNYADAIVAMSKRHDEIEKEKRDIKKANRK